MDVLQDHLMHSPTLKKQTGHELLFSEISFQKIDNAMLPLLGA